MVNKAQQYKEFLDNNKISEVFQIDEIEDNLHSIVFRSMIEVRGQMVSVGVIFDDTIYNIIRVNVGSVAMNEDNSSCIADYIMELNSKNKLFKYYINPDRVIVLDVCLPALPNTFSPELVHTVLNLVVKEIEDKYPKFMELIWSKN